MADVLGKQTIDALILLMNESSQTGVEILNFIDQHIQNKEENRIAKEIFENYHNRKGLYLIPSKGLSNPDLSRELKSRGIMFIHPTSIDHDLSFFAVRKEDALEANYAVEKVLADGKNIVEVNFAVMARENKKESGEPLRCYKDITSYEKKNLMERARHRGFQIASKENTETGNFDIYFEKKYEPLISQAVSEIKANRLGELGERNQRIIKDDMEQINQILNESSRQLGFGEERDFYVVSGEPNLYGKDIIHVTNDGFSRECGFGNDIRRIHSTEESGKTLKQELARELITIEKPVVLTKDEFESTMDDKDKRRDVLRSKQRFYKYKDRAQRELITKEYDLLRLINEKMSLDNHDQVENVSSFYNGEVGIHEFFEHEIVNAGHIREENKNIFRYKKELDYSNLDKDMQEKLTEYGHQVLKEYYENHEPERYYPTKEDIQESLDEIIEHGFIDSSRESSIGIDERSLFADDEPDHP